MQSNQLFSTQYKIFISGALLALLSACGGAGSQPCTSKISGLSATLADCALHPLPTPTTKPSPGTTPAASTTPSTSTTPTVSTTPSTSATPAPSPSFSPPSTIPQQGFIKIAPNIKLEYLDFGGTGEPILLLTGLGHSAHVFEDFARGLTAKNRVFALTRRGYGASSQPATGYDNATLTEDIRLTLDQLGIQRVHLIGHSIAGEEMTRFAGLYPQRVNRLVYLDAAHDRVSEDELYDPNFIEPILPAYTTADQASLDSANRYLSRIRGAKYPKAELKAIYQFASDGSVIGFVTSSEIVTQHLAGVERPDYSRVKARALAIFPSYTSAAQSYPWLTPASPEWAASNTFITNWVVPSRLKAHAKLRAELINSSVLLIPDATHHLFLTHPEPLTAAILQFLAAP